MEPSSPAPFWEDVKLHFILFALTFSMNTSYFVDAFNVIVRQQHCVVFVMGDIDVLKICMRHQALPGAHCTLTFMHARFILYYFVCVLLLFISGSVAHFERHFDVKRNIRPDRDTDTNTQNTQHSRHLNADAQRMRRGPLRTSYVSARGCAPVSGTYAENENGFIVVHLSVLFSRQKGLAGWFMNALSFYYLTIIIIVVPRARRCCRRRRRSFLQARSTGKITKNKRRETPGDGNTSIEGFGSRFHLSSFVVRVCI